MWWSKSVVTRSIVVSLVASMLTACGFQPIAAPGLEGAGSEIRLRSLVVEIDDDRFAYDVRQELLQHVSIDPNAESDLTLSTSVRRAGLAISAEDEITRYTLTASSRFTLSGLTDDSAVSGGFQTETSLNATSSILSTEILERESRALLARDTARRMLNWLRQRRATSGGL